MESNNIDETRPVAFPQGEPPLEETHPMSAPGKPLEQTIPAQTVPGMMIQAVTQPTPVSPNSQTPDAEPPKRDPADLAGSNSEPPAEPPLEPEHPKHARGWIKWALIGVFALLLVAMVSIYSGYQAAIKQRMGNQATQVAVEAQAQFDLGVQDAQAGRYDLARQRFEYVMQIDPNFAGVTEKLAEVLLALNTTATPTLMPTPTVEPTLDTRGRDELFVQAQAALTAGDWTTAIDTLLTLRKREPTFMAVKVDGMLFVALRNRGVGKIANQADLEGGTYDLALAEKFGPLDVEARNWRDWATLYVRGASFWDVDWAQAVFYFSQLSLIAPNLMDGSGYTAWERNILALIGYGDWYARQEMYCDAQQQYAAALELRGDPVVQPTADYAWQQCEEANQPSAPASDSTPTPTPTSTLGSDGAESTPTATQDSPTDTPTEEPTETQPAPSDTPSS